ncbi:uncharacterized protein LOC107874216 [Capsicum annuum]|uniref:uncharacterized protein LOC107874216 n=1 Tax=Capsicum annuum TaxID=4072 RepID=UPI001FB16181|nr:uncharacterized protein LOC107874216 [Capsicum annuum]
MVNTRGQDWSQKLNDALWAYRTTFKTPIYMSLYNLVYGTACNLPIELEHKALWALKRLNLNWNEVVELLLGKLNEMDEFCLKDYEIAYPYKENMMRYHNQRIENRDFQKGDWVLLFNSRMKLLPGKLNSKCSGPFRVNQVYPSKLVQLKNEDESVFKVNG